MYILCFSFFLSHIYLLFSVIVFLSLHNSVLNYFCKGYNMSSNDIHEANVEDGVPHFEHVVVGIK
jgi:hypothetical protein